MKALGYPLTWQTLCFIGLDHVGCGAATFAHTNGEGDFVLFDSLGPPWPIHSCYLNRDRLASDSSYRFVVEPPMPKKTWKNSSDIQRVDAQSFISKPSVYVIGYLQEHHLKKRDEWIEKAGGVGAQIIWNALSSYPDQFTIVTGDSELGLRSFTAFRNLKKLSFRPKDVVRATLRAITLLAVKNKPVVFVADDLSVMKR